MIPAIDSIEKHSFCSTVLHADDQVVDLGANHGAFSLGVISKYGCRVLGVEPVPDLVAAIPKHPNLVLETLAISKDGGPVSINLNRRTCASTTFGEVAASTVQVPGTLLSTLLDRHSVERVALLKVDIEGAEIELFSSCTDDLILRIDQITIEFHDTMFPDLRSAVASTDARLRALRYQRIAFSLDNTDVLYLHEHLHIRGLALVWVLLRYKYAYGLLRLVRRYIALMRPVGSS